MAKDKKNIDKRMSREAFDKELAKLQAWVKESGARVIVVFEGREAADEVVLFDRSWYNRAGSERVMGFCTDDEYERFLRGVPLFERWRKYPLSHPTSLNDANVKRVYRTRYPSCIPSNKNISTLGIAE